MTREDLIGANDVSPHGRALNLLDQAETDLTYALMDMTDPNQRHRIRCARGIVRDIIAFGRQPGNSLAPTDGAS